MRDNKLYLEALKKLPNNWIDDQTHVSVFGKGRIMAINPKFAPIIYKEEKGEWEDLKI